LTAAVFHSKHQSTLYLIGLNLNRYSAMLRYASTIIERMCIG